MPLTDQEKVRIRFHMGYVNVAEVQTFVLGSPAGVETQFLIEGAMVRVLETALPLVREIVQNLDTILGLKVDNLDTLTVDELGEIKIRKDQMMAFDGQYDFWRGKLADVFGVPVNPFEKAATLGSSMNVPVVG